MAGAGVFVSACAALLCIAANVSLARSESGAGGPANSATPVASQTVIVRLRSFAPRASGHLEVKPTKQGGRVRLTVVNLPPPQSLAPNARAFIAWASGGRILRLGELRRDARGGGSLTFTHPSEFARYSLIVTAEASANAVRPAGTPVFSTRANEIAALYPVKDNPREAARRESRAPSRRETHTAPTNDAPRAETSPTPALRARGRTRRGSAAGDFYSKIDEAIENGEGGRTLVLVGDRGARQARGWASVATQNGAAYVRVRFRRVPSATRFGAGRRYAMWALIPEDGTVYMGSLPARNLNGTQTYARTEGVNSDKFRLLVTAERRIPAIRPTGRRVLITLKGRRRRK